MNKIIISILIVCSIGITAKGQQILKELTLDQTIEIAVEQSPAAIMAKHRYRSGYWQYRSFKRNLLPSLNLEATLPDLNRSMTKNTLDDGSEVYVDKQNLSNELILSLKQNIGLTGGVISVNTDISHLKDFNKNTQGYKAAPIFITFRQPLLAHNPYRWSKKIEPLKYESSKNQYLSDIENVRKNIVNRFFQLIDAQIGLQMAEKNFSNNDTIYKIAKGRYNIGTIAKNELLQTELNYLNSATALHDAKLRLEERKFNLRSYLGYNEKVDIKLITPTVIPDLTIDINQVIELSLQNNYEMMQNRIKTIETEKKVAETRLERFSANLFMSYGLNQTADYLKDVYVDPKESQRIRVGVSVPLLDWGKSRGNYLMAKSNHELTSITVNQDRADFEQNIKMNVMEFSMQDDQLVIAQKADTIANLKYDVTLQRFYIGKVDIVNLNIALKEKDEARKKYIASLQKYWSLYYSIRSLALYDFLANKPISFDYESLVK